MSSGDSPRTRMRGPRDRLKLCYGLAAIRELRRGPMKRLVWFLWVTGFLVTGVVATPAAAEDAVAQFYKGRQITVEVGSSPGGGYDIYARLMARHLGKYIPGNPTMVVTNMPGAGSNAAVAHVYNVAAKDGTFIVAPQ